MSFLLERFDFFFFFNLSFLFDSHNNSSKIYYNTRQLNKKSIINLDFKTTLSEFIAFRKDIFVFLYKLLYFTSEKSYFSCGYHLFCFLN